MSVLFPKVQKPREWDYRPIYYDPEKEARKDKKLARLHHGSFREEHEKNMSELRRRKKSRLGFLLAILLMLLLFVWVLS
ncbi:MAG: hypothetical protein IKQ48_06170 [Paludibacteraceae bacterium]|jgi:cell division septal protein FtsQ|nr:hypothetical protein [Paludibacteraceae bacterium]